MYFFRDSRSPRLQSWNYSSDAWYFVTICTQDKKHYFGEVSNEKMTLNQIGKITNDC